MAKILKGQAIQPGDTIGVFSPSEPIIGQRREQLNQGLAILKNAGFKVSLGRHCFERDGYTAGTPAQRAQDFNYLINDPDVKALFATWGGKSSGQILPLIDYKAIDSQPKLIIGHSDVSAIMNAVYAKVGLVSFYGPNILGKLAEIRPGSLDFFFSILSQGASYKFPHVSEYVCIRPGVAEGRLVGGNLSTFCLNNVNTEFQPDIRDAILFFESGSKNPQDYDQLFTFLALSGVFECISGVIIGEAPISDKDDRWSSTSIEEVLKRVFCEYQFPVLYYPNFGHSKELFNPPIPIGARARIDANEGIIEVTEEVLVREEKR